VTICAVVLAVLVAAGGGAPEAQSYKNTAPESFRANGQATEGVGGIASSMTFQIDAYTPDAERERLLKALAGGGSPAFVAALKKAPAAGYIEAGKRKVVIRYAREVKTPGDGRRIVLVTDAPVYFVGGGAIQADGRVRRRRRPVRGGHGRSRQRHDGGGGEGEGRRSGGRGDRRLRQGPDQAGHCDAQSQQVR
jgi:hypothetical protein